MIRYTIARLFRQDLREQFDLVRAMREVTMLEVAKAETFSKL